MNENKVYIPIKICSNLGMMCDWLGENGIREVIIKTNHSENAFGRALVFGFTFAFQAEEDAMAFKLRWL